MNDVVTTKSTFKINDKECKVDGSLTASLTKPAASLELKCGADVDVALSGSLDNVSLAH